MKKQILIKNILARKILDSWGNLTIEVEVETNEGIIGSAMVSSEINITDEEEINKVVDNINSIIKEDLVGKNVLEQVNIDGYLKYYRSNRNIMEKNAIIGVSMAVARAGAKSLEIPLYQYIGGISGSSIPTPMINMISGGKPQETHLGMKAIMIAPKDIPLFSERLKMCVEVYRQLKEILKEKNQSTGVGDGGGFCPNFQTDNEALDTIMLAIQKAGYQNQFYLALNIDTETQYQNVKSRCKSIEEAHIADELINIYKDMVNQYPILSIQDGLDKDDWNGWKRLTQELGEKVFLVGNTIFKNNSQQFQKGIKDKIGNSIIIKMNKMGTVTEAIGAIKVAKANGYMPILSHCTGETEDTFLSDFAVALNLKYVQFGAPIRSENNAKYNQLLRIEESLLSE